MTRWKMVPTDLSLAAPSTRAVIREWLAAAPKWEPSEEDVERALETFCCVGPTDKHAMRAALKAAFEEGK